MTSTHPPTEPPSPATPTTLEPQKVDGASEVVVLAEEAHARATANLELFGQVYRQVSPRLHARARRQLKSEADAEDLVQVVCWSAWDQHFVERCAGEWRRMVAYLMGSADNHLFNQYRGRARERTGIARLMAFRLTRPRESRTADRDALAHEIDQVVDNALEELPPVYRDAFNMVCRDGMTYQETAEKLQASRSTIRVYVSKAKRHVGKALTAAGYGPYAEKKEHTP